MDISLQELKDKKNLLAFSAGVDSTALFFLLLENKISFDIAIVNYNLRKEAIEELTYAKELAKRYDKRIYIKEIKLTPPSIEEKARKIRYQFFEEIIKQKGYENLITAHQLNDQFEWFLMQFSKGAGLVELIGMEQVTKKDFYQIVRPLLFVTKKELKEYLDQKKIRYFIDESNMDLNFTRNFIRHTFSDPFLARFAKGVKKSFHYLLEDKQLLQTKIFHIQELYMAPKSESDYENLRTFDKMFKNLGYLLSSQQKGEILAQKEGVIGGKIAFAITDHYLYAAPFIKTKLDKKTKELLRKLKIPPILRGYIFKKRVDPILLKNILEKR